MKTQDQLKNVIYGNDDEAELRTANTIIRDANLLQKQRDTQLNDPTSFFNGPDQALIRQQLQFPNHAPRHVIEFKSKSEEERFMRLALRIYSLHMQSKDEVLYTYQRTFKYLSEMLATEDFQDLTFFNVNNLIDSVFQTKKVPEKENEVPKKTLKNFICSALHLPYN